MLSLFTRRAKAEVKTPVREFYRDYRRESAFNNFGFYINRCNGRMIIIKRNQGPAIEIEQIRVLRDYMRELLGHI